MSTLKDKLVALTADYAQEKKKLEELLEKRRSLCIPEEELDLAEFLHSKICRRNHVGECGWYYNKGDWTSLTRKKYLEKAAKLLAVMDYETAIDIIKIITH